MPRQNWGFHTHRFYKILILLIWSLLYNTGYSSGFSPLQIEPDRELFPESSNFVIPTADLRLPVVVKPSHYKIESRPILDESEGETRFTAPGKVTITVEAIAPSRNVTLHVNSERITVDQDNVKVRSKSDGAELTIIRQYLEPAKDFYIIELLVSLSLNFEYEIEIPYVAILPDTDWVGNYRAYYVDPQTGITHYMSTTKFEPYHARKAFPSFDEPALKAVFEISLARKTNYHSLSNSIIRETVEDPKLPGWTWDHYEPTELMTTYLVCMIVSDFKYTEANSGIYPKPVKSWAPSHLVEGGKFAANTMATILSHYEKLFGLPYTFPKMDAIFIPQFPSGAMENWGLNTYREELFMYYDGVSTEANRAQVASVLAHELSHQWFGNLVTCKWWSDIWLNEGFASYWMYFGLEGSVPEFDPHNRFHIDSLANALTFDEGPNTHPIRNSAEAPDEISAVFDTISYHKAGSVIRMVENIFGRDQFHKALTAYLEGTKYSNAEQDDLFRYLHAIQGSLPEDLTIKEILDTWTLQSGYPLVRVTKISNTRFFISQEKYVRNNGASSTQNDGFWHIPVSVISGSKPDFLDKKPKLWLKKNQLSVSYNVDESEAGQWLILNADATGFYRVLYSEDLLIQIENQLVLNASVIPPLTRSQLIDNYFNFLTAGYVELEQALRLTKYLGQENTLSAWTLLTNHMRGAVNFFSGISNAATSLKNYMLPKVESALKLIGFEQKLTDRGTDVILRAILLDWACALGHTDCLNYASTLFKSWKDATDGINPIPTDIQTVMYCGAISNPSSAAEAFQFFYDIYKRETRPTLKAKLLNALGCAKEGSIVDTLLVDAITPESEIADSDRTLLLQKIAANPAGRITTLTFINSNLGNKLLTADVYAKVITSISSYVSLEAEIDQIQQGIDSNSDALSQVRPSLDAAIQTMKKNVKWMSNQGNRMIRWFDENPE